MKRYLVTKTNKESVVVYAANANTVGGSMLGPAEYVKFWNKEGETVAFFKLDDIQDFRVLEEPK